VTGVPLARSPGRAARRWPVDGSFLVHNEPGQGPALHHHPYDETFVILEGRVRVQVGEETVDGGPGDIVIGPPGIPHGFTNLGPERARLVCIHAAPAMHTEFLAPVADVTGARGGGAIRGRGST
jgi:mannose-6-phosphate isomerase-like protein (cupin superfamily)